MPSSSGRRVFRGRRKAVRGLAKDAKEGKEGKEKDARPKGGPAGVRLLVLGCDGMDPKLVRRMIDDGRLPHFAKLAAQGGFVPLETSIPPQSPVAWSNFITGAGPGVHGIFDFLHRDPTPTGPSQTGAHPPGA